MILALLFLLTGTTPSSPIDLGDTAFAQMRYADAESLYVAALPAAHDSASVLWRLARVCVCQADVAPRDAREGLYRAAERYAARSIAADSSRSEGHTWHAAALGNIAMMEGAETRVRLCRAITSDLRTSIALNPNDDIAYSIQGSLYLALSQVGWVERQLADIFLGGLPPGGLEDAEHALQRAIQLAPNVIRHHFELGRVYLAGDRREAAAREFQTVTALPLLLGSDANRQREAAAALATMAQE